MAAGLAGGWSDCQPAGVVPEQDPFVPSPSTPPAAALRTSFGREAEVEGRCTASEGAPLDYARDERGCGGLVSASEASIPASSNTVLSGSSDRRVALPARLCARSQVASAAASAAPRRAFASRAIS